MTEVVGFAQTTRVAILDFDNISGIAKYDGLGKAMSSMLISDIETNVSPKRLQLVERAQIQKLIKEQNFQASSSVDKSSAVKAGKILAVNYLLVGDIYILNDQLIINARLTNTETGDIVFAKKQEGKTAAWLMLKTNIAKDIVINLSQPFSEPSMPDKETSFATITTFGNAVVAKDAGDLKKAEILISTAKEFDPGLSYLDDLKEDVDKLKKQVAEQEIKIKVLEKSGGLVINAKSYVECWNNILSPLTDDVKCIQYLEYIIDNYPSEASDEPDLYAFPLIWEEKKYKRYITDIKLITKDINRMKNHIYRTINKNVACKVYKKRIEMIVMFHRSYDYIGFLNEKDIQSQISELNGLFDKYLNNK